MENEAKSLFAWLREEARAWTTLAENRMRPAAPELPPEAFFDPPLLGAAAGDDPLWERYLDEATLGDFHWTPERAFLLAYPGEKALAGELSVLVWILPQTARTRGDNAKERLFPSERWARTRILGEPKVNAGLASRLVDALREKGIQAVAPSALPQWRRLMSSRHSFASTWSERHAAFVAGLGTFGLSDGLITPLGKAVRVGSLVLRRKLPVTPRPYSGHRDYCLHFQDGSCGACVKRCPAGSVRFEGRDKERCHAYLRGACADYVKRRWDLDGYGCGLCQTKVPCASGIPSRARPR